MIGEAELDPAAIARSAGSEFEYRYRELPRSGVAAIRQYISRTRALASPIATSFDDERNAEWFIRSYLALKLVLSSTLLANTAIYARDHDLQAVRPYPQLLYYAELLPRHSYSACRACHGKD